MAPLTTPPAGRRRRSGLRAGAALGALLALTACAGQGSLADGASRAADGRIPTETLMRLGDASRDAGNLAAAAGFYSSAHERAPDRAAPLVALASVLARMGEGGSAVEAYRAALAIDPADADARRGLGKALLEQNQPDAAIPHFEAAMAKGPDARALNGLGIAHDLLGAHDRAQAYYRRALDLAPGDLQVANNLGLSLAISGQHEAAIALLEDLARDPRATPRFRQNLALAYGLAGRTEAARQVGQVDLDPAAVQRNLDYYEVLRALEDGGSTAGAVGVHPESGGL